MIERTKKATFKFMKDRIWKKLNSWSSRNLSQAGREMMIKSILQSIQTYVMSIFLIPSTLIEEIEKNAQLVLVGSFYQQQTRPSSAILGASLCEQRLWWNGIQKSSGL
jgi:ATP-dependent helicase/DNAse subunit B